MDYDTYEDLQGLWADLEAALALVLTHPAQVGNFEAKVLQLDAWLQELLAHDRDAGLYLMYQLASSSHTGYSAAHALVCATLSHILADTYHLPPQERDALVRAALTMNIGMTQLQDQLALQRERPSAAQQEAIRMHPVEGRRLLERMQITNGLWLDVVTLHHINIPPQLPLLQQQAAERLARLLATVDRYAAMINPRRSRAGRSVAESVHVITGPSSQLYQKAGDALLHSVGMYPPGVFIALNDETTAVVMRRTAQPHQPQIAKLLDARKLPFAQPQILLLTQEPQLRITHSLSSSEVRPFLDTQSLLHLGALMTNSTPSFQQITQTPGQA